MRKYVSQLYFSYLVTFIFVALVASVFPSCVKKDKVSESSPGSYTEEHLITEHSDADPKITKINDLLYLLPDNDSIILDKPLFKVFEGKIAGKEIRVILSKKLGVESTSRYNMDALVYIPEEERIRSVNLSSEKENIYIGLLDSENGDYTFKYNPSGLEITLNDNTYRIEESSLKFSAYDRFEYNLRYCCENQSYNYTYSYTLSFKVESFSESFKKVFTSKSFLDTTLGQNSFDISQWSHMVADTITTHLPEDEACFNYGYSSYIEPFYVDSNIFVLQELEDVYSGGAHGTYSTIYHNYDINTGKVIQLGDIIDIHSGEYDVFFENKVKESVLYESGSELNDLDSDSDTFYILSRGITFVFPMYALGGGAWEKEVFISFEELRPFLKMHIYEE